MFKISPRNSGFHLIFDNGITLSTQFGGGSYCDNYDKDPYANIKECKNAEIAIWDKNYVYITKEVCEELLDENIHGNVCAYVDINTWLKIIDRIKNKGE